MWAESGMRYSIGQEQDPRRDFVTFDGGVDFVHRAGENMAELERMLPPGVDPEQIVNMRNRNTNLKSQRLEAQFIVAEDAAADGRTPTGLGGALRLAHLSASGEVYLRDRLPDGILEVHASQLDYDACPPGSAADCEELIFVYGSETKKAHAYFTNPQTGDFISPVIDQYFEYRINDQTFRAPMIEGTATRN
jgi:hypothetical protein